MHGPSGAYRNGVSPIPYWSGQALQFIPVAPWGLLIYVSVPYWSGQALQCQKQG